jgi:hypothetical protein
LSADYVLCCALRAIAGIFPVVLIAERIRGASL